MLSNIVSVVTMFASFIAAASSLVAVYLHYLKDMAFYKLDSYRERLNNMYIPFYRAYCTGRLFSYKLTDFDEDIIVRIINLFNDNIHYLDTASQTLFCSVYFNFTQWTVCKSMGLYDDACHYEEALNSSFIALSKLVLLEYQELLSKCRLPQATILPTNQVEE